MESIFEFIKGFDLQQIISLVAVVYFMTNSKFNKLAQKLESIESGIKSIDRRLLILETRFEERGPREARKNGTESPLQQDE